MTSVYIIIYIVQSISGIIRADRAQHARTLDLDLWWEINHLARPVADLEV